MATQSVWMDRPDLPAFPRLAADLSVDVAVVGGGITGLTAAYLLQKDGHRVALLERDRLAQADTGHTTAHLTYATDLRIREAVKAFGEDHARAAWDAGRAAIEFVHDAAHAEGIDCDFHWVPGYLHAPTDHAKDETAALKEDADLAARLGFDARFLAAVPHVGTPGVRFADQARFDPLKYLAGLAKALGRGCQVFEQTEVTKVEGDGPPFKLTTPGGTVTCNWLVIATHVPLTGVTGTVKAAVFQSKLAPYTSYVVGAAVPPGAVPDALFSDTADPYRYLRTAGPNADFVVYGGEDHKTGQAADADDRFRTLEAALAALVPGARPTHRWSGQVIETADGLPFIGPTAANQFVATGYGGNGMMFGTVAAMMAADAVAGRKNPWADLFSPGRTRLSGAWDYVKENSDYPYYMVRDRLAGAEGTTADDLKPGDGKILRLNGTRVAASRDAGGTLTCVSPVCTHMGCYVRWNPAEATWDCPCHGSRFRPTGEVLAGPAETPLAAVDPVAK